MMMKSTGESEPFRLTSHGASGPNMKRWPFAVGCRMMMMTITMLTMIVSSSQEDAVLKDDQVVQDWPPLGNSPLPPPSPSSPPSPLSPLSPRTSWLMFINNSNMRKSPRNMDKRPPRARGPPAPRLHSQQVIDDLHGTLNESSERAQVRLHESVKAAICVESLCHTKLLASTCPSTWTTPPAPTSTSCLNRSSPQSCWEVEPASLPVSRRRQSCWIWSNFDEVVERAFVDVLRVFARQATAGRVGCPTSAPAPIRMGRLPRAAK
ncbi:uncharacterized protein si:ch1073-184j22.1 isoform X3 [Hippocampus zosterae]|uniref:uncharacterized protein si:ch1073-184j22.1 isoform X3 n=1 Tax=Hippocampus zosterae TaxID=109293 RepID=UPI00223CC32D|nr:uncharacterized protein si:ch1073-184j22.1 isoform X3 [Hippocampus zosterae]